MNYTPDKFTKIAVRVVLGAFVLLGLAFLFFRGLFLGDGKELLSGENVIAALIFLVVCLLFGVAWIYIKKQE